MTKTASCRCRYRWQAWWLSTPRCSSSRHRAPTRRALSLDKMEAAYRCGFRVHRNSAFVARLDLAFSREGFIPLLRF